MKVTIKPANPDKPHFVGHVEGVDARKPLAPQQIAALESGLARVDERKRKNPAPPGQSPH